MELSYLTNYYLHSYKPGHIKSHEQKIMLNTFNTNYIKSFILFNLLGIIANFRKRNRSFLYKFSVHSFLTMFSFFSSLYYNRKFFNLDFIFSKFDPHLIIDTSFTKSTDKDSMKAKIFQAVVLDKIEEDLTKNV